MKMMSLLLASACVFCAQGGSAQTAAISGKNYGGVNIQAVPARGAAGSPIGVELRFAGLPATGNTQVTYTTEGALKLSGPAQQSVTPDSKGAYRDTVVVQAAADGAYFLNVFATTSAGTSVLSLPVTVGAATLKPRAAAAANAASALTGRRVIELPGQETRR